MNLKFEQYDLKKKKDNGIRSILFYGSKAEILNIMNNFQIEYEFDEVFSNFSITLNKINLCIMGVTQRSDEYNCVKYFGYKYSYKEITE